MLFEDSLYPPVNQDEGDMEDETEEMPQEEEEHEGETNEDYDEYEGQ